MSATTHILPDAPSRNGSGRGASVATEEGAVREVREEGTPPEGDPLLPLLRALDVRLRSAVDLAMVRLGTAASSDPYRGLVLDPDEVARSLDAPAGAPAYSPETPADRRTAA